LLLTSKSVVTLLLWAFSRSNPLYLKSSNSTHAFRGFSLMFIIAILYGSTLFLGLAAV
jgi:hypothetical protein